MNCSQFPFFMCTSPYVIQIIPQRRDFVSVQSEKLIWVAISGEGNLRNRLQSKINNNISEWLQIQLLCHRNVIYLQDVMMTSATTTTYNDNVFPPADVVLLIQPAIRPGRKCHCLHWILIGWLTARAFDGMGHQSVTATYPTAVFICIIIPISRCIDLSRRDATPLVPWMGEYLMCPIAMVNVVIGITRKWVQRCNCFVCDAKFIVLLHCSSNFLFGSWWVSTQEWSLILVWEKLDLRIQVVCPGNSRRINYSMDLFGTAIQHTLEKSVLQPMKY